MEGAIMSEISQVMETDDNDSSTVVLVYDAKALVINLLLFSGFVAIGGYLVPSLMGTFERGLFCNDDSIRYPYKDDTVSVSALLLYTFFVKILTVTVTEWLNVGKQSDGSTSRRIKVGGTVVNPTVSSVLLCLGYAEVGLGLMYVFTKLTKSYLGRLRPYFLDVCKLPSCNTMNTYITNYTCTGDEHLVLEARRSFFSGHSAFAMYASTFAVLYLSSRFPRSCRDGFKVALPLLQTTFIIMGLLISYSRINDNKHHWSDVVVGIIVGASFASYTCIIWAEMFKKSPIELLPLRQQQVGYTACVTECPVTETRHSNTASEKNEQHTTLNPEPLQKPPHVDIRDL